MTHETYLELVYWYCVPVLVLGLPTYGYNFSHYMNYGYLFSQTLNLTGFLPVGFAGTHCHVVLSSPKR